MGLTSFGLYIGIFCGFLCSVLLLSAILELYFLGLALSRPQVRPHLADQPDRIVRLRARRDGPAGRELQARLLLAQHVRVRLL